MLTTRSFTAASTTSGTIEDLRQQDGSTGYARTLEHGVIGQGLNDYDAIFSTLRAQGGEDRVVVVQALADHAVLEGAGVAGGPVLLPEILDGPAGGAGGGEGTGREHARLRPLPDQRVVAGHDRIGRVV